MRKPKVKLSGEDGNVYCIIAKVRKALRNAGQTEQVEAFTAAVKAAESYDAVLQLAMQYCDVR